MWSAGLGVYNPMLGVVARLIRPCARGKLCKRWKQTKNMYACSYAALWHMRHAQILLGAERAGAVLVGGAETYRLTRAVGKKEVASTVP